MIYKLKMNKGILIWGYFCAFLLLLGAIFTNQGFLAGKVLFLVSYFSFNLGYLIPLFFTIFKQNQENKIGTFLLFGGIGFFLFLTGISFFAVSWGGGIVLIYIGGAILILAILTMIVFSRRFYETTIYTWFPVLIFTVFIIVGLLTSTVNRNVMRLFNLNNHKTTLMIGYLEQQNEKTYNNLCSDSLTLNNALLMDKVKSLKFETDKIYNYIEELKIQLIKQVEGNRYKIFEGERLTNLFHIQSNVELNSGKRFMLKKQKKAIELKNNLETYRLSLLKIVDKDKNLSDFINFALNTEPYNLSKRRYEKNWEYQNFYDFPLLALINQLTNMQEQIKYCEKEILLSFHECME